MIRAMMWLWPPGAPPLRQWPEAFLRAALFGLVVGVPLSFVFTSPSDWRLFWLNPWDWCVRASVIGGTLSLSFYAACGLPVSYLLRSPRRSAAFVWTTAILGGILGTVTAFLVLTAIRPQITPELIRIVIIPGLLAATLAVLLTSWHRLQTERDVAEARARNHALLAQINPHFFFNTLNTIAALIRPAPDSAERTVGLLADMSRYAFTSSAEGMAPLDDELAFARTYLEIEKLLFGDRLRWVLPQPGAVGGIMVPVLAIQPLVENAVRHGISHRIDGGVVEVSVMRTAWELTLTVRSPAVSTMESARVFNPGHALYNIRERHQLAYGDRASIQLQNCEPDMICAVLHVPVGP